MLVHPELLGLESEREADELRQVQHRHVQRAADDLLGQRLLEVQVEVAERARRDQAVRVRVGRVAEMGAGLAQRTVGRALDMPVLHLPQLVGLALGLDAKALGLARHVVKPTSVIDWTTSVVGEVGDVAATGG